MQRCQVCERSETFLFRCPECGGEFCHEHQDPRAHSCEASTSPGRRRGLWAAIVLVLIAGAVAIWVGLSTSWGVGWLSRGHSPPAEGNHDEEVIDLERVVSPSTERLVFQYVNQVREEAGSPLLDRRSGFDRAAGAVANGTISNRPRGADNASTVIGGLLPNRTAVTCTRAEILQSTLNIGEPTRIGNRSVSFEDPRELARGVVYGWLSDPSRRPVLTSENWSVGGVAVNAESAGRVRVVVVFCEDAGGNLSG
ncbi:MAG: AN1-type zinc finger domain-containing protein [Halodesulfurarchaeum sp.]